MRVTEIFAESARNKAATDQNSPTTVAAHNDLKRSQDRDSSMALENTKEKEVTAEKYITLNDGEYYHPSTGDNTIHIQNSTKTNIKKPETTLLLFYVLRG